MHYTNVNFAHDLERLLGTESAHIFMRVDNLFDKEPPFPLRTTFGSNFGREYRVGLRFDF